MGTWEDLIALGRRLQAAGYQVGENPAFGRVTPGVHAAGSAHYTARGDALDINYDGHGQAFETSKLQAIVPAAKALGLRVIWQTTGHFDHIHIDDRPGPDIGNTGATGSTATAASPVVDATPAGLGLDQVGDTVTKAVIIGLAVMSGAGLVLLGLTKAAGKPAGKLLNTIAS